MVIAFLFSGRLYVWRKNLDWMRQTVASACFCWCFFVVVEVIRSFYFYFYANTKQNHDTMKKQLTIIEKKQQSNERILNNQRPCNELKHCMLDRLNTLTKPFRMMFIPVEKNWRRKKRYRLIHHVNNIFEYKEERKETTIEKCYLLYGIASSSIAVATMDINTKLAMQQKCAAKYNIVLHRR